MVEQMPMPFSMVLTSTFSEEISKAMTFQVYQQQAMEKYPNTKGYLFLMLETRWL
jgi:hypothetical protein